MESWMFHTPTKIYFGRNQCQQALEKEQALWQGNLLVVSTGRSLYRLGYLGRLLDRLQTLRGGRKPIVYDSISANPKLEEIQRGIALARSEKIDMILGFGGGSAMDAAKAIAAGLGTKEPVEHLLFEGIAPTADTPPIVAIPTTAGTGSELSKGAIISDLHRGIKTGIRGEHIYPTLAIIDPSFTDRIPYWTTMETGFDVLAHAMESLVSRKATPFSQLISHEAIRLVGKALPQLAQNLSNTEARDEMSYASTLMGINLGNVGTALPHRLQYPIGAHTDTSHGAGLMALYPAWLAHEYEYSAGLLEQAMTELTGQPCHGRCEVLAAFERFMNVLNARKTLKELGIAAGEAAKLAQEVTGNVANDPAATEAGIIEKIYVESME